MKHLRIALLQLVIGVILGEIAEYMTLHAEKDLISHCVTGVQTTHRTGLEAGDSESDLIRVQVFTNQLLLIHEDLGILGVNDLSQFFHMRILRFCFYIGIISFCLQQVKVKRTNLAQFAPNSSLCIKMGAIRLTR